MTYGVYKDQDSLCRPVGVAIRPAQRPIFERALTRAYASRGTEPAGFSA